MTLRRMFDRSPLPYNHKCIKCGKTTCIAGDSPPGVISMKCPLCGTVQEVDTSDRSKEDYHGKKGGE